ncbi:hypothetical protein GTO27_05720 [Candidatus Bathyarchaeota archaeon]|nr:hypothetical protein [Candidatus Bathyarchaeota archaeon]
MAALTAADLVETLSGPGPFTVFAPTNDAFAGLPPGVVDYLLANIPALTEVLTYHVVLGELMAADLSDGDFLVTLQGDDLLVSISSVMINDATVVIADVDASNGVIHVIDKVLVPQGILDIVDTAINAGSFTTLVAALQATGLDAALRTPGPFTVFAPTDEAFAALEAANPGIIADLLANPDELANILKYHVVSGKLMSGDVLEQKCLLTLQGNFLNVETDSGVMIDGAEIIALDIECSNGVIHVIDTVMVPDKPPIHSFERRGWARVYKYGWYYLRGRAKLELYPLNSINHPGGNPHDEPVCAWVVRLTICARGWYRTRWGNWRYVRGKLDMFYIAKCWKQCGNRVYLRAMGHAWTWNGMKLYGEPVDMTFKVYHYGDFWVRAWGWGIRFYG